MVFVKDGDGRGMVFTEPTALTPQWSLRLAEPLPSPSCAYAGYLGGIFIGVLKMAHHSLRSGHLKSLGLLHGCKVPCCRATLVLKQCRRCTKGSIVHM